MKKTLLFTTCLALSPFVFAAPTIEQRNLSTMPNSTVDNSQQNMQIWELKQQVQQLQNQVRQLLGNIEEKDHQYEQLNSELENRYTDLDQRIQLITEQLTEQEQAIEGSENVVTDADTDENTTPTNPLTSAKAPNNQTDTAQTSGNPVNVGADQAAYNAAYEAYQQGGAAKAIEPMQSFINTFPNSVYISHAYYWLGEFNLSLTPPNIHEARDSFEVVAGNYPQSNKAAAALYRLVELSLNIDKDINKARTHYQQLIQKYPNTQEAKTAKNSFSL